MHTDLITFYEVEVIYLRNNVYKSRKFKYYPEREAYSVYQRTFNKLSNELTEGLITLRDERGNLVKCDKLNEKAVLTKKKK